MTHGSSLTTPLTPLRAIVLSFDRLPIWCLQAYGGGMMETPRLNRLAAQSVVFDRHFCECAGTAAAGHAWWTGSYHFGRPGEAQRTFAPAWERLTTAGVHTTALLEDGKLGVAPAVGFESVSVVEGSDSANGTAAQPALRRLIDAGVEAAGRQNSASRQPWLIWLKARGLRVSSPQSVEPRQWTAEVAVIDDVMDRVLRLLEELSAGGPVLFVLTGALGAVPEGMQGLGVAPAGIRDASPLCEPVVRTPLWIWCRPDGLPGRIGEFAQNVDLVPTLFDWFDVRRPEGCEGHSLLPAVRGQPQTGRTHVCLGDGGGSTRIQSDDLALIVPAAARGAAAESPVQLFAKPDDFWEVNNLADQSPDAVESLRQELQGFLDRTTGSEQH